MQTALEEVKADYVEHDTVVVELDGLENIHFWVCSLCNITFAHLGSTQPPCPGCGAAECVRKGR